jgi:hypothetical protein
MGYHVRTGEDEFHVFRTVHNTGVPKQQQRLTIQKADSRFYQYKSVSECPTSNTSFLIFSQNIAGDKWRLNGWLLSRSLHSPAAFKKYRQELFIYLLKELF